MKQQVSGDPGVWIIASNGVWRPGTYASERAANYAQKFKDEDLQALQDSINPNGIITFKMLQALYKKLQHDI